MEALAASLCRCSLICSSTLARSCSRLFLALMTSLLLALLFLICSGSISHPEGLRELIFYFWHWLLSTS